MNNYTITCCSTADLPAEFYKKTGIAFAKFHFSMNGKEYDDDLGLSITPEDFYQKIREGALPVTSQVNVQEYEALFESQLAAGLFQPCRHLVLHVVGAVQQQISAAAGSQQLTVTTGNFADKAAGDYTAHLKLTIASGD